MVIVQNPAQIKWIKRFSQGLSGDPAAIVVLCSNQYESVTRGGIDTGEVLRFVNLGIVASYILLTTYSMGLGNCPVRSFHRGAIKKVVGLPENIDPELLITLGYPAEPARPKTHKDKMEVISYDWYQGRDAGNGRAGAD